MKKSDTPIRGRPPATKVVGPPPIKAVRWVVTERRDPLNKADVRARTAIEAHGEAKLTNNDGMLPFGELDFVSGPESAFNAVAWIANIGKAVERKITIDEHLQSGIVWESPDNRIQVKPQRWHQAPNDYFGDPVWGIEVDGRWLVCCVTEKAAAVLMAKLLHTESQRVQKMLDDAEALGDAVALQHDREMDDDDDALRR